MHYDKCFHTYQRSQCYTRWYTDCYRKFRTALYSFGKGSRITKSIFFSQDIPFLGMRFTKEGLNHLQRNAKPWRRWKHLEGRKLLLFLCCKLIPVFSKLTENIRALQKKNSRFNWTDVHQNEFDRIKSYFSNPTTLSYFR